MRSIDQRAITKRFDYDGLGQLITKGDKWTSATIVEQYEYDKLGRRTLAILTNGGTEKADVRYYYATLGRLTRESQQISGGDTRNVDYLHNKIGNRTRGRLCPQRGRRAASEQKRDSFLRKSRSESFVRSSLEQLRSPTPLKCAVSHQN